jgi:hypothetical protein
VACLQKIATLQTKPDWESRPATNMADDKQQKV